MEHLRELITRLQLCGVPLKQGELMCRHTSFGIGGPAAVMVFPENEEQMEDVFRLCREEGVRPLILGAGTNVLCADEGLDTLLVETKTNFSAIHDMGGGILEVRSGCTLSRLATYAMEQGLSGLEFAHGIPGTVGGGVYMNAGAYGGEMAEVLRQATVLYPDGRRAVIPAEELDLRYRHSRFMEEDCLILTARFHLQAGDKDAIRAKMTELKSRRRTTQPLEFPSAGSTFKRPVGGYAAALIEEAGLKGRTVGGAQVSQKHAGFVINRGRATCRDVLALMDQVTEEVFQNSGIRLEPEVRIWR